MGAAPSSVDILNQLFVLHNRSLPMYLASARPWFSLRDADAEVTLRHIVEDQRRVASRMGELILELRGVTIMGEFPMTFTDMHDLSLEYLLPHVIERQQRDVEIIRGCVNALAGPPVAKAAAEEALGAAQGHLDSLTELQQALAT